MEYLDFKGDHSYNYRQLKFKGNILLASFNIMSFGRPSRKDDLVQLCFLLLSIMKQFDIVKLDTSNMNSIEYFRYVTKLKRDLTLDDYCHSPKSRELRPFMDEVWKLEYEEEPNYDKLKFLLANILLQQNVVPKNNLVDLESKEDVGNKDFDDLDILEVAEERCKPEIKENSIKNKDTQIK